ncbi:unnamed protein product [Sphagnum balticum]
MRLLLAYADVRQHAPGTERASTRKGMVMRPTTGAIASSHGAVRSRRALQRCATAGAGAAATTARTARAVWLDIQGNMDRNLTYREDICTGLIILGEHMDSVNITGWETYLCPLAQRTQACLSRDHGIAHFSRSRW